MAATNKAASAVAANTPPSSSSSSSTTMNEQIEAESAYNHDLYKQTSNYLNEHSWFYYEYVIYIIIDATY